MEWKSLIPEFSDNDMIALRMGRLEARPQLVQWWVDVVLLSSEKLKEPVFTETSLKSRLTHGNRNPLSLDLIMVTAIELFVTFLFPGSTKEIREGNDKTRFYSALRVVNANLGIVGMEYNNVLGFGTYFFITTNKRAH